MVDNDMDNVLIVLSAVVTEWPFANQLPFINALIMEKL